MNSHIYTLIENSIDAIIQPDRWNDLADQIVDAYALNSAAIVAVSLSPISRPTPYYSEFLHRDGHRIMDKFKIADDRDDMPAYSALSSTARTASPTDRPARMWP